MTSPVNRGQLFIVSAPSGVGKTTIINALLPRRPELRYSVSSTTRRPRQGEIPGKDYHFLSKEEFLEGIRADRFLEWAEVHGQYYGTDGDQIEKWLSQGSDILLDIDVQGARQVRCAHPHATTIFILPPSPAVLLERLKNRGTESAEQLAKRFGAAGREMREAAWYDYIIVNDVIDEAVKDLEAILRAGRCSLGVQAAKLKEILSSSDLSPGA